MVTRDAIRAYALRSRTEAGDLKRRHWADEFRRSGPGPAWDAAQMLWAHARRVRPEWPTARDRELDLVAHLRLCALFDRSAHAFAGR